MSGRDTEEIERENGKKRKRGGERGSEKDEWGGEELMIFV